MHLRCCFALVFVTLFVGAGVTGGPIPKNIYVHQGDPAYFQVQMQIAMKYAHFGGNEAAPDAVPLYMSVSQDNRKIEAKNTPYTGSGRLRFCGDLSTGLACFSLTNVGLSDNKKIFRIHYKENNDNSAKYQDFMIVLLEVTSTSVLNVTPTAISKPTGNSTNVTSTSVLNVTPTAVSKPTGNSTNAGNNTKGNTTSKTHDTTAIIVGSVLAIGCIVLILTFCFIKWCIKRRNVNAAGKTNGMEMTDVESSCNTTKENTIDESICETDCFEDDEPAPDLADGDIENYTNERPGIRSKLE